MFRSLRVFIKNIFKFYATCLCFFFVLVCFLAWYVGRIIFKFARKRFQPSLEKFRRQKLSWVRPEYRSVILIAEKAYESLKQKYIARQSNLNLNQERNMSKKYRNQEIISDIFSKKYEKATDLLNEKLKVKIEEYEKLQVDFGKQTSRLKNQVLSSSSQIANLSGEYEKKVEDLRRELKMTNSKVEELSKEKETALIESEKVINKHQKDLAFAYDNVVKLEDRIVAYEMQKEGTALQISNLQYTTIKYEKCFASFSKLKTDLEKKLLAKTSDLEAANNRLEELFKENATARDLERAANDKLEEANLKIAELEPLRDTEISNLKEKIKKLEESEKLTKDYQREISSLKVACYKKNWTIKDLEKRILENLFKDSKKQESKKCQRDSPDVKSYVFGILGVTDECENSTKNVNNVNENWSIQEKQLLTEIVNKSQAIKELGSRIFELSEELKMRDLDDNGKKVEISCLKLKYEKKCEELEIKEDDLWECKQKIAKLEFKISSKKNSNRN